MARVTGGRETCPLLVPPRHWKRLAGALRVPRDPVVCLREGSGLAPHLVAELRLQLAERGGGPGAPLAPLTASPLCAPATCALTVQPRLGPREHRVRITSRVILVEAGGSGALREAITALVELLGGLSPGSPVPAQEWRDEPDFAERGFMLDVSRCKVPLTGQLQGLVWTLPGLRMNQLQLYTEHTFAFAGHEEVWRDASPLTPGEVLELDASCEQAGVGLVPNFNSFGHFERFLRHPAYFPLAESPRGFTYPSGKKMPWGTVLKPNPASLRFVDRLHAELLPHFRDRRFNVGCDETWELGQGWSKALCARKGKYRVYLDFLLGLHRGVTRHARRMQFWGDIILKAPELIPELPKDLTALAWGYEAEHPFAENCRKFRDSGVPLYVCPGTSSWRGLSGRDTNLRGNLRAAAAEGRKHGAEGFLLTDWGDEGHHQVWPVSFNGLALAARLAWRADPTGADAQAERLANRHLFDDPTGRASAAFAEIGRLPDLFAKKFTNSAVFHHLLFAKTPPDWMGEIAETELREARARLREIRAADGASGCRDRRIPAEFHHTCRMLDAALRRGLAFKDRGSDLTPTQWDRLRASHRRQWLARNRPGGLEESLGHFPGG